MIKFNSLSKEITKNKKRKRLGRGNGNGHGTTCGRGNKGANSRSGAKRKLYYEGGQTPLSRRIPKKGFSNIRFKKEYQILNLDNLEKADIKDTEIDTEWLYNKGFIKSKTRPVKVLGRGEFSKKLKIKANAFSKSAREKIEELKGKAEVIGSD